MTTKSSPKRVFQNQFHEGAQSHIYQPLPEGEWFRLLRVLPGTQGDHLHCELIQYALKDAPPYKALSYVWGDPGITSEITCSEHCLRITSSLLQCLKRIRDPSQSITVWADAICINQLSISERSHQVDLMAKIYATADEVLVCLGEDDQGSAERAFRSLIEINFAIQLEAERDLSRYLQQHFDRDRGRDYVRAFQSAESRLKSVLGAREKDCVGILYNLPWFKRVWVLQEVGLAKSATAIWGSSTIDFSQIALFIHFCSLLDGLKQFLGSEISDTIMGTPEQALWNVWSTFENHGWLFETLPLRELSDHQAKFYDIDMVIVLEASRNFEATNPLDHIYAFLGHPQASLLYSNQLFRVDYSVQVAELNRVVAQVLAHQSFNFLVQVQHPLDNDSTLTTPLPSWVPQWNTRVKEAPLAAWEASDASLRKQNKSDTRFQILGNELTVPAIFIGAINLRSNIMMQEDFNMSDPKLDEVIEMCWNLTEEAQEMHPAIYGEDAVVAFSAVLTFYHKANGSMEDWASKFCELCSACNKALYVNKVSKKYKGSLPTQMQRMQERVNGQREFARHMRSYCRNRRFFTVENGYWGLGAPGLQKGDICAVIYGADVPFILRQTQERHQYKLIGQCYISGVMFGELLRKDQDGTDISEWKDITIV